MYLVGARPEGLKSGDRITQGGCWKAAPDYKIRGGAEAGVAGEIKGLSSRQARRHEKPFKPEILRRIERYGAGTVAQTAPFLLRGSSPADNHIRYWNDLLTCTIFCWGGASGGRYPRTTGTGRPGD